MSGSVLSQTAEYLPNPPVEQVNQSVEYLSANQQLQAINAKHIKITPANGNTFSKSSNMIEFRIPKFHHGFIDGTQTKLNLTLDIKPVKTSTNTVAFGCYSTGSFQNAIKKWEVLHNGEVLESCHDYGRQYFPLSVCSMTNNQLLGAGSVVDTYANTLQQRKGGLNSGAKLTNAINPTGTTAFTPIQQKISIPISLSSLFGPGANKAIPSGMLREGLVVRLTITDVIPEMYYTIAGDGTSAGLLDSSSDYSVTNVSLEVKALIFSIPAFEQIKRSCGRGLISWNGGQFMSNASNVPPGNNNANLLMPNTNYRDCRCAVVSSYYSSIASNTVTFASLQAGWYRGNILVNGDTYWNGRSIGTPDGSNLRGSRSEAVMGLVALSRNASEIFQCDTQFGVQYQEGANLTAKNWDANATDAPASTGPSSVPSCLASAIGSDSDTVYARTNCAGPYVYWGVNMLRSTDKSRRLVGTDLRGRQCVINYQRNNTIPSSADDDVIFTTLVVGCRFDLDPETGTIHRIV